MAQPYRDSASPRHNYTASPFRQRLRNLVETYDDTGVDTEPNTPLEDKPMAENSSNIDFNDALAAHAEEKLVLFPTYARVKPHLFHETHHHSATSKYVDVELHIHGQASIPSPPNTPLRRKDRLILSVARRICGLPSLPTNNGPGLVRKTSMDILMKISGRSTPTTMDPTEPATPSTPGDYSKSFWTDQNVDEPDSFNSSPADLPSTPFSPRIDDLRVSHSASFPPSQADRKAKIIRSSTLPPLSPATTFVSSNMSAASWKNSHNFPSLDLETCHANLTERLSPFMARTLTGKLVTVKVYAPPTKEVESLESREVLAERQFLTNENGHFTGRLIVRPHLHATPPDTWTITASLPPSKTSSGPPAFVQENIVFIPEYGVSMISDVDDTVKHTSILSGARELFRNTFVRDLSMMTIDGVKEWYSNLIEMGVQIHYVSNSPYQCWPIVKSFIETAGLPSGGSIHLKQYSGVISGIMENPAEKKRPTIDAIMRDFPNRKFILVGDSGEQDLELYTDLTLTYRKQVLGIFIRDVTTPLLAKGSRASSSSVALPQFFDGNGQPVPRKEGRFRGFRDAWRVRSQDRVPSISSLRTDSIAEEEDTPTNELEELTLKEIDPLSPLVMEAKTAGEGVLEDLPYRKSKTPPPMSPTIPRAAILRAQTFKTFNSATSESVDSGTSNPLNVLKPDTPEKTGTEEQSSRVKKVENWKKRLVRAREKLLTECGVEIWTWRVGDDVQAICESLIMKSVKAKQSELNGFNSDTGVNAKVESM